MNKFPEKITEIVKQDLSWHGIVTDVYWVTYTGGQLYVNLEENFVYTDGLDDGHPHKYEMSLGFMLHNGKPRWVMNRNTMPDIGQDKVWPISWSEYWREIALVIDSTLELLAEYLDEWVAYEAYLADKAREKANKVKTFWDEHNWSAAQKKYMTDLLEQYLRDDRNNSWWPRGVPSMALMNKHHALVVVNDTAKVTFNDEIWQRIKETFSEYISGD